MKYRLRGYDRCKKFLAVDFAIPDALPPMVRQLLPEAEDDPDFIDTHEITSGQAARLANILDLTIDSDQYYQSVESGEDPCTVAARVAAMRAKA